MMQHFEQACAMATGKWARRSFCLPHTQNGSRISAPQRASPSRNRAMPPHTFDITPTTDFTSAAFIYPGMPLAQVITTPHYVSALTASADWFCFVRPFHWMSIVAGEHASQLFFMACRLTRSAIVITRLFDWNFAIKEIIVERCLAPPSSDDFITHDIVWLLLILASYAHNTDENCSIKAYCST